jgi:hypothetical protein
MATITQQQATQMFAEAEKQGVSKDIIFKRAIEQGHTFEGLDVEKVKQELGMPVQKEERTIPEKIADFTGGKELAQGLAQVIAEKKNTGILEDNLSKATEEQTKLLAEKKRLRELGEDTSRLDSVIAQNLEYIQEIGSGAEKFLNPNELTSKEVIGDALQLATTVAGVGTASKTAKTGQLLRKAPSAVNAVTGTTGLLKGAGVGALKGAGIGAGFGATQGVAQGLQDNGTAREIAGDAVKGGVAGLVLGGLVGGVTGGITGSKNAKELREGIITAQEQSGVRPSVMESIQKRVKTDKVFAKYIKDAQKQGFTEKDINFLATISDADKPTVQKMFELTAKAQSNPRQITRAADVLGENATNIVKQVEKQNKVAGKLVDTTAKSLKGNPVDVTTLRDGITSTLDDAGIILDDTGKLDFSQSVFKNTPKLQKEIQRVIQNAPDGSDAYQLHIYKKSIDELVDYGTTGEGLSGRSASILKGIRNSVDDVLDSTFDDYNKANTEFKTTKDFIEEVKNVVGKKVDFSTKEGAQQFGQAFRSAFSNNKSRGATLKLVEDLQNIAKQRNLNGAEQNLLDQALYVNILEDTFGSQAATGLASEVSKGVKTAKGAIQFVRNPVEGTLNAVADQLEKVQNITPEAKKQLLMEFIK